MNDANLPDKSGAGTGRPGVILGGILLIAGLARLIFWSADLWALMAAGAGVAMLLISLRGKRAAVSDAAGQQNAELKELKRYVGKTRYLENVGDFGGKAADQMEEIARRYTALQDLLAVKFEPGELTRARYHGTAEKVYLGVLENLRLIATALNNADPTNFREITTRIAQLSVGGGNAEDIATLQERLRLYEQQIATVTELLSSNEKAINEFDRVRAALAATQTKQGVTNQDLESAMADLARLAERAKKYGISPS